MIKFFLKYDYCLAEWFVPKKRKSGIEPMVSYLFLGKLSFIYFSIYCIIIHYIPYKLSIEALVIGIMAGMALIMYGFQKSVARWMKEYELRKKYKYLPLNERRKRNFIGLTSCILIFYGSFFIGVKMIGGYAVK